MLAPYQSESDIVVMYDCARERRSCLLTALELSCEIDEHVDEMMERWSSRTGVRGA
jgi:hypothetical protein